MVLVTGANGFVGTALCQHLAAAGFRVRAAVRSADRADDFPADIEVRVVGETGAHTPWREAMSGVTTVVHLVSGVSMAVQDIPLLERYRAVNVAGTESLATAAAAAGVRRMVLVSTIKVNGESTARDRPYTEADTPLPEDAYGQSKWEAERMVWDQTRASGMTATVLRPPIVYGPGVKGNFLALMDTLRHGSPLPLASIDNRRSLIYIGNLLDAIVACMASPVAAGKTYLVSDGEDMSTPGLIRQVAAALGVRPRLLPCPPTLLALGARLLGRAETWCRLGGSLQVDSSKIRRELGWHPPFSVAQGLEETGRWYLKEMSGER